MCDTRIAPATFKSASIFFKFNNRLPTLCRHHSAVYFSQASSESVNSQLKLLQMVGKDAHIWQPPRNHAHMVVATPFPWRLYLPSAAARCQCCKVIQTSRFTSLVICLRTSGVLKRSNGFSVVVGFFLFFILIFNLKYTVYFAAFSYMKISNQFKKTMDRAAK